MKEEWKWIKGYEGKYKISTLGRVMTFQRYRNGRIMSPCLATNGYYRIILCFSSTHKPFTIHKLVVTTFIGKIDKKYEVNHINGIKTDNRLVNLEICTKSDNLIHSYKTGLRKPNYAMLGMKGENNPSSKPIMKISKSGEYIKEYPSITDAAHSHNVSKTAICNCANGKTNTSAGYIWKYNL